MQSDRHARSGSGAPSGTPGAQPVTHTVAQSVRQSVPQDAMTGRLLERRYQIGSRIARGGMASVYEATDLRLDRTVAVKIMHAGLADDQGEFAARFVREARSAARLSHPNVVAVYDQGDDEGTIFLAMELIDGHTLRDTVAKESPMSPLRALALLEPVLSALAAAHRAGIIHRDIKPENVLIADDGRVKVADFGLAKAISADTQHTATGGVLIGTVSYLAPELVVDGRADARADVYAAGVLLYELLTGAKPHAGESPIQVAYKHVHEDVPPPSRVVPGIPAYVDALVARATARDRGLRPADASVLLHQVHRVTNALAAGVRQDDDLTDDLRPRVITPDTAPDMWDAAEMAALLAPSEPRRPVGPRPAGPPPANPAREQTSTLARPGEADVRRAAPSGLSGQGGPPGPPRAGQARGATRPPRPPRERREKSRRSKRGPILLVLALLIAGGVGAGAWWFGYARYTTTPGVLGLSQSAAQAKLEAAGLDVELGDAAYSDTVPAGMVSDTEPAAGDRILDGDSVTLTLSQGEEVYAVPVVEGMSEDDAQDAIGEHFTFGTATGQWSEKAAEGTVLRSKPKSGVIRRPGTAIDIVISKGRRPIPVEDFTGKDAADAQEALEGRKLVVGRSEQYSDTVPAGGVISQTPSSGTLFRGQSVSLVVSRGPELVEVPGGLVASGVESARSQLEALGFQVEVKQAVEYIGVGFVYRTSPGSGEMVPKGSTIILYLI